MSVVMPVFNAAATLERAVGSLRRQRGVRVELICVDDGSTDASRELLQRLAAAWPDMKVITQPHRGIVAALNTGLEAARHRLIARMDADDVAHPARLARQAAFLCQHPQVGVVGTRVRSFPAQAVSPAFFAYEAWSNSLVDPEDIAREIYVESPIVHPSAMYRRDEVLRLGGYRDVPWPEDYDLWLRYHHAGLQLAKLPRVLLGWRMDPERLSFRDPRCSLGAFLRCKAHFLARDPRVGRGPVVIWGAGMTGRRLGKALMREGVAVEAFVDIAPKLIGGTKHGRPVYPIEYVRESNRFVIVAVGAAGAREEIRGHMRAWGREEGKSYLFAA
ncbi:MAG TPA: glycosyltransferase [Limnochordales bacterium]|nr:glycosyltransferase [Limnochordales bacterium]